MDFNIGDKIILEVVETRISCENCFFRTITTICKAKYNSALPCDKYNRKDSKNIIFRKIN